ncbi:hypothetical protein NDU88_004638 [Pleurodeles waltl]|uniref:Uncharacterized protein n=1 Tax=Pleurodeles waltl TaxID=8319 RepID=A0AAV7WSG4_PLEWA|nr:hypothetical protein NDU88_004638 [Pleurodeles waltl]
MMRDERDEEASRGRGGQLGMGEKLPSFCHDSGEQQKEKVEIADTSTTRVRSRGQHRVMRNAYIWERT